jgi:hypothetical protein
VPINSIEFRCRHPGKCRATRWGHTREQQLQRLYVIINSKLTIWF